MNVENYMPVFDDFEELQVLFQCLDELAGEALDGSGTQKDSALWLISKCSALAARDIDFLIAARNEMNNLRMKKLEERDTK